MIRNVALLGALFIACSLGLTACTGAPTAPVTSAPPAVTTTTPSVGSTVVAGIGKTAAAIQVNCQDAKTGVNIVQLIDPSAVDSLLAHNPKAVGIADAVCAAAGLVVALSPTPQTPPATAAPPTSP
jgi:hypothetical protein